jgi:hypothetical protein
VVFLKYFQSLTEITLPPAAPGRFGNNAYFSPNSSVCFPTGLKNGSFSDEISKLFD